MTKISEEDVRAACVDLLNGGGSIRAVEGQTVRGPFSVEFELGGWRGEICSSYSSPDFYRFLTSVGRAHCDDETCEQVYGGRGYDGSDLILRTRNVPMGNHDPLGGGSFANYWRRTVEMCWDGLPVPYPVCYMQRKGRELLIFERKGVWRELGSQRTNQLSGGRVRQVAELMYEMHQKGYYHRRLSKGGSVKVGPDGRLLLDHLEGAWKVRLPVFAHEVKVGADLAGVVEGTREAGGNIDAAELARHYFAKRGGVSVQNRIIAARAGVDPIHKKGAER